MKGLDTAIATRIAAGDTIIKVVDLLCRCVDESGYTQALYCMDKAVLVRRPASRLDESGLTLLCTITTLATSKRFIVPLSRDV